MRSPESGQGCADVSKVLGLVPGAPRRDEGQRPIGPRLYEVAADTPLWLGPAALVAGVAWMIRGLRSGPGDRGEALWGLFLVLLGLFLTPAIFLTSFHLVQRTGSC